MIPQQRLRDVLPAAHARAVSEWEEVRRARCALSWAAWEGALSIQALGAGGIIEKMVFQF